MRYEHIGWYKEGVHDKVWGVICLREHEASHPKLHPFPNYKPAYNDYLTFWGRRGHKLQTKLFSGSQYKAEEMFRNKLKKGYTEVNKVQLDAVYPEFQTDLEKTAMWAMLKL
jgi:hypothetical protein